MPPNAVMTGFLSGSEDGDSPEPWRGACAALVEDRRPIVGRPLLDDLSVREVVDVDRVPAHPSTARRDAGEIPWCGASPTTRRATVSPSAIIHSAGGQSTT